MADFTHKSFISVVGDIYCDIIAHGVQSLPNWGEDSLCDSINLMAGGSALNTVIHGANYSTWTSSNASFQFFSAVGNDSQVFVKVVESIATLDKYCSG